MSKHTSTCVCKECSIYWFERWGYGADMSNFLITSMFERGRTYDEAMEEYKNLTK